MAAIVESIRAEYARYRGHEALHRSLAHTAYHVGQIVFIAKARRGASWTSLSIPAGRSDAYNRDPQNEHGAAHAAKLSGAPRT